MCVKNLTSLCEPYAEEFFQKIKNIPFEAKGIFNSEMLVAYSLAKSLGVSAVIESGRARGQSTSILCELFDSTDKDIISIEWEKYSFDSVIAAKRLKKYPNVELLYGDAFKVLPNRIKKLDSCIVIIDGPKGTDAVLLASKIIKDPNVKAVLIHDLHCEADGRGLLLKLSPQALFTDDKEFVDSFSYMDVRCWEEQKTFRGFQTGWEPYMRRGVRLDSYSSTFGMVINNEEVSDISEDDVIESKKIAVKASFIQKTKSRFRRLSSILLKPLWLIRLKMIGN